MIEAIGRLERALSRIETLAERPPAPQAPATINQEEAVAALRSLDALIADLKETVHG